MNCPLCGNKNAVALFSSVECGGLCCPNYNKKQYEPRRDLAYWQIGDCTSTPEEIKQGILKVNIQIMRPLEFIKFSILNKDKELK